MNLDSILNYCAGLKGSIQDFPFDENTLAMKVMGKIYALIDVEKATYINLKCDPERAIELRELHSAILPGYHMNKKHWNSVGLDQDLDDSLIRDLILHSYELVVKSLPKKLQNGL
ncbi:MAG: MmcQ/YjbR family DNA-binding protein [Crocinitomicaceae bacterium]|nr:MmcQ/YjbR family DNA-binding protein [Crocinitomicaceae bacterium]